MILQTIKTVLIDRSLSIRSIGASLFGKQIRALNIVPATVEILMSRRFIADSLRVDEKVLLRSRQLVKR